VIVEYHIPCNKIFVESWYGSFVKYVLMCGWWPRFCLTDRKENSYSVRLVEERKMDQRAGAGRLLACGQQLHQGGQLLIPA
jgi:hypothetical protein